MMRNNVLDRIDEEGMRKSYKTAFVNVITEIYDLVYPDKEYFKDEIQSIMECIWQEPLCDAPMYAEAFYFALTFTANNENPYFVPSFLDYSGEYAEKATKTAFEVFSGKEIETIKKIADLAY